MIGADRFQRAHITPADLRRDAEAGGSGEVYLRLGLTRRQAVVLTRALETCGVDLIDVVVQSAADTTTARQRRCLRSTIDRKAIEEYFAASYYDRTLIEPGTEIYDAVRGPAEDCLTSQ